MFIPFLAAVSAATAFAKLRAMSVKIAMLTALLQAVVLGRWNNMPSIAF